MKLATLRMALLLAVCGLVGCRGSEADRQAKEYWNARIVHCGGSYLAHNLRPGVSGFGILEFKDVSPFTIEDPLTEAQKLNGFEWVGRTGYSSSSMRFRLNQKSGWSQWIGGGNTVPTYKIWRKGGKWEIENDMFGMKLETNPDCSLLK